MTYNIGEIYKAIPDGRYIEELVVKVIEQTNETHALCEVMETGRYGSIGSTASIQMTEMNFVKGGNKTEQKYNL